MYTKIEMINEIGAQANKIEQLYKSKIINYTGNTVDTDETFTEVIAEQLMKIDIKNRLKNINEVVREKGYRMATHDGAVTTGYNEQDSNRKEERFAIKLFNLSKEGHRFDRIGNVLDYQIPLKNSNADLGLVQVNLEKIKG